MAARQQSTPTLTHAPLPNTVVQVPDMPGQLFTHHFLTDGITGTPEWESSEAAALDFQGGLMEIFESFQGYRQPNEAVTEQELIRPVLELLGWADYLPQQGAARNEDIPDLLLFPDAASKERAAARSSPQERYRDAVVVEESKRFGLPLDARDADGRRSSMWRKHHDGRARPGSLTRTHRPAPPHKSHSESDGQPTTQSMHG